MRKTVHIMVGIPASGKTTISKQREAHSVASHRVSSDEIRDELETKDNTEIFQQMNKELIEAIKSNQYKDIYYDATNINRRRRRGLYRNIKSADEGVEVNIVFMSVPLNTALKRNKMRTPKSIVPEEVILRMHRELQVPRVGVDCDRIEVMGIPIFNKIFRDELDVLRSVEDVVSFISSEWKDEIMLSDTSHDCSPWHSEDIFTHIDMAIENSRGWEMKTIALFHDLGKGICKVVDKTGYATYRNHANVGAHYFLNYFSLTKGLDNNGELNFEMMEAIHQHMNFHNELGVKNIENNVLNDAIIMMGSEFATIDNRSKVTKD